MSGYRPGELRPVGDGPRVAVVAPEHCHNGHPLGPYKVMLGTELCDPGTGRYQRHITWTCRTCGDVTIADGHPDACRSQAQLGQQR
ncbi:hypothetical protein ACFFX1_55075 [Dactylosporangium sucinum]|nr:hypothetical protein [Dactylosporangium sucinum]